MTTWNGAATLPKVLEACCQLQAPAGGWALLVVDDGSDDGSADILAGFAARLPLRVLGQPRRGRHAARNHALQQALAESASELFLFLADDCSPDPDWLLRIDACARRHPGCAMFGGPVLAAWSEPAPPWVERLVPHDIVYGIGTPREGKVAPGALWDANMALRREVFAQGYRFDTALGARGDAVVTGSDSEFKRRLAVAGVEAWCCSQARVHRFIRTRETETDFILRQARRYGRGARLQEGGPAPLGRLPAVLAALAAAAVRRDADAGFGQRWQLHYMGGYIAQAWFGGRRRLTRAARVLLAGANVPRLETEAAILRSAGCDASLFALAVPAFCEASAWRWVRLLRARWGTAHRLRAARPDLMHIALSADNMELLWLASHCKVPVVLSVHEAPAPTRLAAWHIRLYNHAFRTVRGVVAVTPTAMAAFMDNFKRFLPAQARLEVIADGVDAAHFAPNPHARAALGLPDDALVLGALQSEASRPDALIALFCALHNRYPTLHLLLIGAGAREAALRAKLASLGLAAHVVFTGEDRARALPACTVHVHLARRPGAGHALLDAMACAVPVVCSLDGADLVGEGGLAVAIDDGDATIAAVAGLLDDAAGRAAMGQAGRRRIDTLHSPQHMEQRLRSLYGALMP